MTHTISTFAELREELASADSVGLVPTMGYLHEGHLSLIEAAKRETGTVVMSLFVNPLQFDEKRDLDAYPRDLERDARLAGEAGVDVIFAPSEGEMYPDHPVTKVTVDSLTDAMEGAHRPGHFEGVATVVAKLFAGIRPDRAYFGRKDAQQLAVIGRMAHDLSFPVAVVGCPIVRHRSGLAMSSRNTRLHRDDIEPALTLSTGLMRAADAVENGERSSAVVEDVAAAPMRNDPRVDVEYVTVASSASMQPVPEIDDSSVLAMAARIGDVRLIDNIHIDRDERTAELVVDRGVRLDRSSVLFTDLRSETEGSA